jgi:hypothetical protein
MLGRRLPDTRFGDLPLELDDLQPGDIWKYLSADGTPVIAAELYPTEDMSGNLTGGVWGFCSPDGNGIGTLALHTVREHDDGTVSIRPGDGSSNSVLHSGGPEGKTWHGYVEHGVWQAC